MNYKELKATVLSLDETSFEYLQTAMNLRKALKMAIERSEEIVTECQTEMLKHVQKKLRHEEELKHMMRECQK